LSKKTTEKQKTVTLNVRIMVTLRRKRGVIGTGHVERILKWVEKFCFFT
jgi:hypothetical protein